MGNYERLSGLDACFLGFETANAYMHVAVTAIFERGPLSTPGGGIDIARIRRTWRAACRHYSRSPASAPRADRARSDLADDDEFDLVARPAREPAAAGHGGSRSAAPSCSSGAELPAPAVGAWVIEGLQDGGFALVVKVHHCIVDGIAGIGMLAASRRRATADAVARAHLVSAAGAEPRGAAARRGRAPRARDRQRGALGRAGARRSGASAAGIGAAAGASGARAARALARARGVLQPTIGPHRQVAASARPRA
jgi:hypothetical protein